MNSFHFIPSLLFFFAFSLCLVKSEILSKCCPTGWNLQIKENSIASCEPAFQGNQSTFDAYNVKYVNKSSIPKCQYSLRKLFKNNEKYTQINGCVDRTSSGDLLAVSCHSETVIDVHELYRCCTSGEFYDHSKRRCATYIDSDLNLKRFFNNEVILFQTQVPDCGPNEVFVEYVSTAHEIEFFNHDLLIFGEILEPKSFCVEGLAKISPNEISADHLIVRSCRPQSICNRIPCIRRCCKTDQVFKYPGICEPHPHKANFVPILHGVKLPMINHQQLNQSYVKEFGVLHSLKCEKSMLDRNESHYFHQNGSLFLGAAEYKPDEYCIENVPISQTDTEVNTELSLFFCLGYNNSAKFRYYPICLLISCVFLAMTLIVYLALPNLQNIHGKTLVCYVISCLIAYTLLAFNQLLNEHVKMCTVIGLVLVYSFVAVFCWQTVMCVDIWLTFGTLHTQIHKLYNNKRDNRRFFYYLAYAWGFPFGWTMFTLYASKYEPFPEEWNPKFGLSSCFFSTNLQRKEHFLYFLLPTGIHVLINFVLFTMTAIYCSRVKREIHRMQTKIDEPNAKRKKFIASKAMFVFVMNLKLFTVMGISWILEIMPSFVENPYWEFVQDSYNLFMGVAIFVIFVCKKKVYREFKSRIGIKSATRGLETSRSTTATITHTIAMKDLSGKSTNDLPLLGGSAANLNKIERK